MNFRSMAVLTIALGAVWFAGCGAGNQTASGKKLIAIITPSHDNPFFKAEAEVVAFGVDIDPAKQGMFMPITGQRILSPAEAVAFGPDLVIIANEIYAPEIRKEFTEGVHFVSIQGRLL